MNHFATKMSSSMETGNQHIKLMYGQIIPRVWSLVEFKFHKGQGVIFDFDFWS